MKTMDLDPNDTGAVRALKLKFNEYSKDAEKHRESETNYQSFASREAQAAGVYEQMMDEIEVALYVLETHPDTTIEHVRSSRVEEPESSTKEGEDYGPICCRGGCCGPGSYCCGHPDNEHDHPELEDQE